MGNIELSKDFRFNRPNVTTFQQRNTKSQLSFYRIILARLQYDHCVLPEDLFCKEKQVTSNL